jgi:hypothetical protein
MFSGIVAVAAQEPSGGHGDVSSRDENHLTVVVVHRKTKTKKSSKRSEKYALYIKLKRRM